MLELIIFLFLFIWQSLIQFSAFYNISFYENIESNFVNMIPPRLLESEFNKNENAERIADKMREFYLGTNSHFTSTDEKQLMQVFIKLQMFL